MLTINICRLVKALSLHVFSLHIANVCAQFPAAKMTISNSSKVLVIRTVLFVTYVLIGGAIFREIEREEQLREMHRLYDIRMEILRKYNISLSDAKKWSDTFLSTSLGNEGFLEWSYGNSVLFAMVVVTTIGKTLHVTCNWIFQKWTLQITKYQQVF